MTTFRDDGPDPTAMMSGDAPIPTPPETDRAAETAPGVEPQPAADPAGDPSQSPAEVAEFTDIANARRFARLHGERVRFVESWKQWIVWNDGQWHRDPTIVRVMELAKDIPQAMFNDGLRTGNGDLTKAAQQLSSRRCLSDMLQLSRGPALIGHEELDADHWALGVRNGWFDLHDGTHHPPDPAKLITMTCPVGYDPDARCPRWLQALGEWMPDPTVQSYFQRLVGEALVGTVRDHLLVVIYGPGGNGKGTAIGTLAKLLGPYFTVPHKSLLVREKQDSHPTNIAGLFRTRLAVASETDSGARLSEEQIKNLTGGDRLTARRMYENFWDFDPTHSLWLQTNYLPNVDGTDEGIWRRLRVLKWPAQFLGAKADHDLSARLEAELPGILNWAIDGCLAWQTEGLAEPDAVRADTDAYRRSEDMLQQWVGDEGWMLSAGLTTTGKDLTDSWAEWTERIHGRRRSGQEMAQRLTVAGVKKIPGRPVIWKGIGRLDFDE